MTFNIVLKKFIYRVLNDRIIEENTRDDSAWRTPLRNRTTLFPERV